MCSLHCSIAEVLQQTRDRHQRARSGKDGTTLPISCEDATFDVMVVVLSLSLELSDNRVDLLVTDPSLPKHACARICLKGQDAVSAVLKGKLTQGDIVRFNKMRIITDYGWSTETKNNSTSMGVITLSDQHSSTLGCTHGRDGSNDNDYRLLEQGSTPCTTPENKRVHSAIFDSTTLPTVICEIRHSWVTPEIGSCFAILATICNKDTNPTISGSVIGGEWTCEFIGMDAVPCNFASPPEAVSNLFHWFISSRSQDAFMMTSSLEVSLSNVILAIVELNWVFGFFKYLLRD